MEQWYEELDFEENPFSTNPSDFVKNIVGREEVIDELDYRIRSGSMVFIEGEEGMGKSALLRLMIKRFRGRRKVIYVNCDKLEDDLNVEDLLVKRNGLLKGSLMKKYPRNMILLMDDVSKLSHLNAERIKYFFDEGYLRSVVFTGESFDDVNFSESLKQRIAKVIKLEKLEEYQAIDLIRERIGDIKFFSDEVIEKVAAKSDYNPKKLLHNSEEVAEFVINIDEDVVTSEHVDKVLDQGFTKSESKEDVQKTVEDIETPSEDEEEKKKASEEENYSGDDKENKTSEESERSEEESVSEEKEPLKEEGKKKSYDESDFDEDEDGELKEAPVSEEESDEDEEEKKKASEDEEKKKDFADDEDDELETSEDENLEQTESDDFKEKEKQKDLSDEPSEEIAPKIKEVDDVDEISKESSEEEKKKVDERYSEKDDDFFDDDLDDDKKKRGDDDE